MVSVVLCVLLMHHNQCIPFSSLEKNVRGLQILFLMVWLPLPFWSIGGFFFLGEKERTNSRDKNTPSGIEKLLEIVCGFALVQRAVS